MSQFINGTPGATAIARKAVKAHSVDANQMLVCEAGNHCEREACIDELGVVAEYNALAITPTAVTLMHRVWRSRL